jgi:hypothetical protein
MRASLRSLTAGIVVAASLALATPAHADTVLTHELWSCDVPYSGDLECAAPVTVPPGAYIWIGIGNGGPTVFTVYSGTGAGRQQIGWGEMKGGEGRFYTNDTGQPVLASVTMHEDAPTDRCGTQHEQGFLDVRS